MSVVSLLSTCMKSNFEWPFLTTLLPTTHKIGTFTGLPKQNLFHHYSYTPIYASLSKTCVMRCNIVALAQGPNCIYRFVDTFFCPCTLHYFHRGGGWAEEKYYGIEGKKMKTYYGHFALSWKFDVRFSFFSLCVHE